MKSKYFIVLLTIASAVHAGHTLAQGAASVEYARAKSAFYNKQYNLAAGLFAQAAKSERETAPSLHSDALLMEGRSFIYAGDFISAEEALRLFIQERPESATALYSLGYVLQRENKPKDSLEMFNRAASIEQPQSDDLKLVALDYVLLDDYIDAVKWLTLSVSTDPNNHEAWYDLGRAQMHQGHFEDAERAFRHSLEIEPASSKALDNLGLSLEAENRTDEALEKYSQAIRAQTESLHPSEQPFLDFGALLILKNRYDDAVGPLLHAIQLEPNCSRCHEELSRAYVALHKDELAIAQLVIAIKINPANPRLHYLLGRIYRRIGEQKLGEDELRRSTELYGTQSSSPD